MRKNRFTLMLLMLSFLLGGLASCQADYENVLPAEELTAADIFVASEKYQNYLKEMRKDSKKMNKILTSLTSEERDEFKRLRYLVPENKEEFNEIVQTINAIIGIDYEARLMKLYNLQKNTFHDTNFTHLDILKALQKYNIHQSTIPKTRDYHEQYMRCKGECDGAASSAYNRCPSARMPWDIHYDPSAYREYMKCSNAVENERDRCHSQC